MAQQAIQKTLDTFSVANRLSEKERDLLLCFEKLLSYIAGTLAFRVLPNLGSAGLEFCVFGGPFTLSVLLLRFKFTPRGLVVTNEEGVETSLLDCEYFKKNTIGDIAKKLLAH